jgi:hypothetical protein
MKKVLSIILLGLIARNVWSAEAASSNAVPADMESMRAAFEKGRTALVDEYAGRVKTLDAEYLEQLRKLQAEFSGKGDNANATAAVREMNRLADEKKLLDDASLTTLMVLQNVQASLRKQITQLKSQQARTARADAASKAEPVIAGKSAPKKSGSGLDTDKGLTPAQSADANQAATSNRPAGQEKKQHMAIGCAVTVSSTHLGEPGEGAGDALVDGDLYTRWSSDYKEPQEVVIDLGKAAKVTEIRLHWERASATRYCVYISQDGKSWSSVYLYMQTQPGAPAERVDDIRLANGECRYIKLDLQNCINKEWGFSLYEIEVQGAK